MFSAFDELVDRYDLEKVKTIGDAYMVVGSLTDGSGDHTARVADMALALTAAVDRIEAAVRLGIRFRIGIHCGPVVAGVIGTRKFIYDIWGDAVDLEEPDESLGAPVVSRSPTPWPSVSRAATCWSRADRRRKGKGPTPTWYLLARAGASGDAPGQAVANHRVDEPPGASTLQSFIPAGVKRPPEHDGQAITPR